VEQPVPYMQFSVRDLVEIWYFIAQDDPLAADRLIDMLDEKYKLLADNPHMGPARPDIAKELGYQPAGNYLLLYRVISGGIELVRVVRRARPTVPVLTSGRL
jgi:toxin ParE1/3/4